MKIHYLSVHEVLEQQEVSLMIELGHEVFSNGAYLRPEGHPSLRRPPLPPEAKHYPEYEELASKYPKTELPDKLIEDFDAIIIMHEPEWIIQNWPKFKKFKKKIVWRSIGQSVPWIERLLRHYKEDGLRIVRYSPVEKRIPDYAGDDAIIRFYNDPDELKDWNGNNAQVINFTQSLRARGNYCHHDHIIQLMTGFPSKIFGSGNDNLGNLNGGKIPYDLLKGQLRDNRVFIYGGTWPAPYTLSFIEAFMTGIPVVSIGRDLAEIVPGCEKIHFFEIPDFIKTGDNGYCSDNIEELRTYIKLLIEDQALAKKIGDKGRQKAIELFGKQKIKGEWQRFLIELEKK